MTLIAALDFETTMFPAGFPWCDGAYAVTLHLAGSDGVVNTWVIQHNNQIEFQSRTRLLKNIQQVVDKYRILVAHNLKFDAHWLRALGIDFSKHILYCTQVAEYLLNYQDRHVYLSLEETSKRYGITPKIDRVKTYWEAGVDTPDIPLDILIPYGEQDTINALTIFYKQQQKIKELGMKKLFQVNMETIRVLQEMEWNGMLVDRTLMEKYSSEYGERIQELTCELTLLLEDKIPELKDIPFKFTSGEHLSVILYGGELKYEGRVPTERELKGGVIKYGEKNGKISIKTQGLKIKPLKGTETAKAGYYQTDIQTFAALKLTNKTQQQVIDMIKELSRLEKLKGTYFDGMQKEIRTDGRIHHNLNQTVTVTGRLSCSKPNLQQLPRGDKGPAKKVFTTRYT